MRTLPKRNDERGAAAVELGIVLSVLFLFVFGIIQFGLAYNRHQGLQAGAREGARVASVGATESDIRDRVRKAQSLFAETDVQIAIDFSTDDGLTFPGGNKVCDDASSDTCGATTAPSPCGRAGVGNLIRVTATVPGATGKYAIIIPLWGNQKVTFSSVGIFRCEESS